MNRYRQWALLALVSAATGLLPINSAWAASEKDACAMLQKADVEAAFSPRKFDSGTPGLTIKGTQSMASVSSCTYTSKGASRKEMLTTSLNVRRALSDATGITPEAAREGAIKLNNQPQDVAGLGHGAYWVAMGGSIQLNVFKGKREWLIFGGRSKTMDNDAMLAALTKIGHATLAH